MAVTVLNRHVWPVITFTVYMSATSYLILILWPINFNLCLPHFLTHSEYCQTVYVFLNGKVGQMKKNKINFFFWFSLFLHLALSSGPIKVFSSDFPRPHAVQELECCAISNLSNGVPSHVRPQKAIFCWWSYTGGEKKGKADQAHFSRELKS